MDSDIEIMEDMREADYLSDADTECNYHEFFIGNNAFYVEINPIPNL